MSITSAKPLVWFITGTSQGFGRELVRAALERGDSVVATSRQQGDPALAADAIVDAVTGENPPMHLLLGAMAYERAAAKLDELRKEFTAWREVALSTDFKD